MKRVVSLILLAILVAAVSGCGSASTQPGTKEITSPDQVKRTREVFKSSKPASK